MKSEKKYKLDRSYTKVLNIVFSIALAASLIYCVSLQSKNSSTAEAPAITEETTAEKEKQDQATSELSTSTDIGSSQISTPTESTTTTTETTTSTPISTDTGTSQTTVTTNTTTSADECLDEFISKMRTNYQRLKSFAKSDQVTEAYQETKEETIQNFKDLYNFVFHGGQINGVTYKDLTEKGKEKAKEALKEIDGVIEQYIPDYKERLQNWLDQKEGQAIDKLQQIEDSLSKTR
jgi:hypothetical protein